MGTIYSRSHSPASVSGAGPARTDVEDICDLVHALNKSVKRQLKETAGGTWSCMSGTRGIRSSGRSRCCSCSREWWPCTTTSRRCEGVIHHPVRSLHHLRLHLHRLLTHLETRTAFWILTIISICSFRIFFCFHNCILIVIFCFFCYWQFLF